MHCITPKQIESLDVIGEELLIKKETIRVSLMRNKLLESKLPEYICLEIKPRYILIYGDRGSTVVKVLCYKSEGSWFDPSWCEWNFSLI